MKKLFRAMWIYAVLGLAAGVFYREFTKINNFTGTTMLSNTHVHSIVLGTLFFFIVMIAFKVFDIKDSKGFKSWFWFYNVSLLGLLSTIVTRGVFQVMNIEGAMLSHIAGTFHTLMAAAIIWFVIILRKSIFIKDK